MNDVFKKIEQKAIEYVRKNKRLIINNVIGGVKPAKKAVAIFMAGSPGAGKTEFSIHFLEERFKQNSVVRIDPDEIREKIPEYDGEKAFLFQSAVSLAIEKILDYIFRKNIHFLLDGTLAHYQIAEKNVKRSIKHRRLIHINYLYQPKEIAWEFTQKREIVTNRNITKEVFENSFENSKLAVAKIKEKFSKQVEVDLIIRNVKTNKYKYFFNQGVQDILTVDKKDNL